MSDAIHIHEDDWGMRSLHPIAAWADATADLQGSFEAAVNNRAPDGIGWTDIHLIETPTLDFTSTGLLLHLIANRLAPMMPRVPRFIATAMAGFDPSRRDPYGSYEDEAWAYGFSADCFIKLEPKDDLVARIWFEARTGEEKKLAALRQAIDIIDSAAEAMIIDYWADAAGRVRDLSFAERYFAGLAGSEP